MAPQQEIVRITKSQMIEREGIMDAEKEERKTRDGMGRFEPSLLSAIKPNTRSCHLLYREKLVLWKANDA